MPPSLLHYAYSLQRGGCLSTGRLAPSAGGDSVSLLLLTLVGIVNGAHDNVVTGNKGGKSLVVAVTNGKLARCNVVMLKICVEHPSRRRRRAR